MKAIDLYSGIGGWTLGLKLAGIEVVKSFEWWNDANQTHNRNFGTTNEEVNIRDLKLEDLPNPGTIDLVVGSPPCTQFSFANRGGSGDIEDGLKDIYKFLTIVRHLRPKYWAMENVPRVSGIIEREIKTSGRLSEFSDLVTVNTVIDISEFGLPQKRKRMIAGCFPVELLLAYKTRITKLTLGNVIEALKHNPLIDPIYGFTLDGKYLTDNEKEEPLNQEELRMNRDAKTYHPVYNRMKFPDSLDTPSRTVTALCTRVSRESIIIEDDDEFRRLTIRERGVLQSFPITFQFHGKSSNSRMKMIGNAVPPLLTFFLAQAVQEIAVEEVKLPRELPSNLFEISKELSKKVNIDSSPKTFSNLRKFRAAIPNLRFGSGMRFDLENIPSEKSVNWRFNFVYGSSKAIKVLDLNINLAEKALRLLTPLQREKFGELFAPLRDRFNKLESDQIQKAWVQQHKGFHPYDLVDEIGNCVDSIRSLLNDNREKDYAAFLLKVLEPTTPLSINSKMPSGFAKIADNSILILIGIIICGHLNEALSGTRIQYMGTA